MIAADSEKQHYLSYVPLSLIVHIKRNRAMSACYLIVTMLRYHQILVCENSFGEQMHS